MVGDDYSGADPAVQNPLFVDANGFISTNIISYTHQHIVYGFDEMSPSLTHASPAGTWSKVNPVSSDENGWYTTYTGGISSLLWYNNGPYATQQTFNYQTEFAFNKLNLWFMILKQYRPLTGSAGSPIMPTIRVFSKPTGTNDYISGLCHSLWDYTMTAGQAINYGESIVIYSGQVNKIKLNHSELRRIVYTNTGGGGNRGNNEIINHIELIYDTPNVYQTLVIEAGIFINQVGLINYYFSNGNSSNADIATIAMKTATDTINTNVATINTTASAINTKLTGMTYQTNRLQTVSTLVDAGGDVATISTPNQPTGTSSIRGLDTQSYLNAYNILTNVYDNLTATLSSPATPSGSYNALDVYARNPSTTNNAKDYIIGGLDVNNRIGLNTYQIFPKKLYYNMGGYSAYNVGSALMAGWGNNLSFSNLSTSNSTFYWNLDSTTAGNWGIIYDYINSSGDLVENATQTIATVNGTGTYVAITGSPMKGVIRWRFDTFRNVSYNLYITPSNSTSAPLGITFSIGGGNAGGQSSNLNGIMIVPNGYVAYIPQLSYVGGANMNICLVKFTDTAGTAGTSSMRQILNKYYYVNLTSKEIMAGNGGGGIGGVFMPGDRFCLMTLDASATARWSNIDVVLEAI